MFKTDETVRFGQILSARTLRYGKFNEYIIIIIIIIPILGRPVLLGNMKVDTMSY